MLTYVMRNLSDTADREFNSTVVKVTPEETEFAVDIQIRPKPGGPAVKTFYHRHWRMVETEPKGYNCGN